MDTPEEPMRRFALFALLALMLGAALSLLLVEVTLRVAGVEYPSFYQRDRVLGVALRPGAHGWYRQEGEAYVRAGVPGIGRRDEPLYRVREPIRHLHVREGGAG